MPNWTHLSILPLPQTCPASCISRPGGDASICTATNTRNFPVTLDSPLSVSLSSPSLTWHFCLLKFSQSHLLLCVPSITAVESFHASHLLCSKKICPFTQSVIPHFHPPPELYVQNIPCFQSPELLKAVPWPNQAARCPVCKHKESLSRREIVCKHRSWVFDCWDSLKTAFRSSHPKRKCSEYSILKPLLPGLERGKAIRVLHDMRKKRKGRK